MPDEDGPSSARRGGAYDRLFEAGIAHLHRYAAEHGSSSPPRGVTVDGFLLGSWVDSRRTDYRLGRLSAERIRRIETEFPDWRWNVRDAMFDVGLAHLRRYVTAHGTSHVPQHRVTDGFPLGQWVTNRRADHRKGRLSAERIALFENEFADWLWKPQDAASAAGFEIGLAHLRRYVTVGETIELDEGRRSPRADALAGAPGTQTRTGASILGQGRRGDASVGSRDRRRRVAGAWIAVVP